MGYFKYDEQTGREWIEVELQPGSVFSRATIQDFSGCMGMEPKEWIEEGLYTWMRICERDGAHGCTQDQPTPRPRVPAWRVRLAERLYTWADRLCDTPER